MRTRLFVLGVVALLVLEALRAPRIPDLDDDEIQLLPE